uniref:Uncharacterized protein n=1 Tax=Bahig virus TaxID=1622279 RepID=A0A0D3R0V9_9VIRU|nr:hypothetical protein [Bahig virus]
MRSRRLRSKRSSKTRSLRARELAGKMGPTFISAFSLGLRCSCLSSSSILLQWGWSDAIRRKWTRNI